MKRKRYPEIGSRLPKLNWINASNILEKAINGNYPEYRAPLIVGLIGQETRDINDKELEQSIDRFFGYFNEKKIGNTEKMRKNGNRITPIYILSALANDTEEKVAEQLRKEYGAEIIKVVSRGDRQSGEAWDYSVVCDSSAEEYIVNNSFILLALWDGISVNDRTGKAVRGALVESSQQNGSDMNDAVIHETFPVYQIVMPDINNTYPEFVYRSRVLLPYILDSGLSWFTLSRAKAKGTKIKHGLISYSDYIGDIVGLTEYNALYDTANEHMSAIEKYKLKRFADNIEMIRNINIKMFRAQRNGNPRRYKASILLILLLFVDC